MNAGVMKGTNNRALAIAQRGVMDFPPRRIDLGIPEFFLNRDAKDSERAKLGPKVARERVVATYSRCHPFLE